MRRVFNRTLAVLLVVTLVIIGAMIVRSVLHGSVKNQQVQCAPVPPCAINVAVDNSASMSGYFTGKTELKDDLAALAAALDKFQKEPQTQHCPNKINFQLYDTKSKTLVPAASDAMDFTTKLVVGNLAPGKESPLQDMLQQVVGESSGTISPAPSDQSKATADQQPCPTSQPGSALSILITDAIFSYPDEAIKQNPEINRTDIKGLAQEVKMIFNTAHVQGKSASLLAFRSHFHGTYYTYKNGKIQWGSSERPYYVWLIGSISNLRSIRQMLFSEGIRPEHAIDFLADKFDSSPVILDYTEREGRWRSYNNELPQRVKIRKPAPDDTGHSSLPEGDPRREVRFAVAMDLSHLSQDQQNPEFLKKHLRVESLSPELQIRKTAIRTREEMQSQFNPHELPALKNATHIVVITTDFRFHSRAQLSISVDDALPGWYLDWTNEDDTSNDVRTMESTFGLAHFIEAISQAYSLNGPVSRATIILER